MSRDPCRDGSARETGIIQCVIDVSRDAQEKTLDTTDELGRVTVLVQADRQAIKDLEEEAREARVTPGWLRTFCASAIRV